MSDLQFFKIKRRKCLIFNFSKLKEENVLFSTFQNKKKKMSYFQFFKIKKSKNLFCLTPSKIKNLLTCC